MVADTIWIACCFDRHIDPVIKPFRNPADAITFAEEFMLTSMAHPEGVTRDDKPVIGVASWSYGYEGDHAYVIESEL